AARGSAPPGGSIRPAVLRPTPLRLRGHRVRPQPADVERLAEHPPVPLPLSLAQQSLDLPADRLADPERHLTACLVRLAHLLPLAAIEGFGQGIVGVPTEPLHGGTALSKDCPPLLRDGLLPQFPHGGLDRLPVAPHGLAELLPDFPEACPLVAREVQLLLHL